ncbi:hypothetical protein [Umezawaea sp. NPDC059074]|uniref:hypothetical protein n=1 Tax=Umezawaea sp. NPDC059074 TaxID=3346716 RepID=UPI00369E63BF
MDGDRVDADRLPADLVALIDALGPGENLVVTRDGEPIASISGLSDAAHAEPVELPSAIPEDVKVVATAMKLSSSARASLSTRLGPDYIVLDMNAAPKSADVLLTPPVSPQLIGGLRSLFPKARVVVTELEDEEFGISYQGPVRRLLDAGADSYLPPSTIPRLAERLTHVVAQLDQLEGSASTPQVVDAPRDRGVIEGG